MVNGLLFVLALLGGYRCNMQRIPFSSALLFVDGEKLNSEFQERMIWVT